MVYIDYGEPDSVSVAMETMESKGEAGDHRGYIVYI